MDVEVSSRDPCCIEVALRCLGAERDGYGLHEANDGGLLAAIMAAGFKGIFTLKGDHCLKYFVQWF